MGGRETVKSFSNKKKTRKSFTRTNKKSCRRSFRSNLRRETQKFKFYEIKTKTWFLQYKKRKVRYDSFRMLIREKQELIQRQIKTLRSPPKICLNVAVRGKRINPGTPNCLSFNFKSITCRTSLSFTRAVTFKTKSRSNKREKRWRS